MLDMDLSALNCFVIVAVLLLATAGCSSKQTKEAALNLQLYQTWELQAGDVVAGYTVLGGLGDLSIALKGKAVYAPYDGRLRPQQAGCTIFSSEDVPHYLLRLCGLQKPRLGPHQSGEILGTAKTLQLAVLNKRPDGLWALVEPSKQILKQMLLPREIKLSRI